MKLQENLICLRKQKGYSQEELAYLLGISRQSVSKWESGSSIPELERLIEIADLFGVSLDTLVRGEESVNHTMTLNDEQLHRIVRRAWEFEFKSRLTIAGIPLVHVNFGYGRKVAKGIIALGNISIGLISIGGLAVGLLSIGGLALGGLVFAGMAIGVIAAGGAALGYAAFGGLAIGIYAFGGLAIANQIAIGGKAIGHIAIGVSASGDYVLQGSHFAIQEVKQFFQTIPETIPGWIKFFF